MQKLAFVWTAVAVFGLGQTTTKWELGCDMSPRYVQQPPVVSTPWEMATRGKWYGRLRIHTIGDKWGEELTSDGKAIRKDSLATGIGGSLLFKSGFWHGLSVSAGIFTTYAIGSLEGREAYLYKGNKDLLSRLEALRYDSFDLTSVAVAYGEYRNDWLDFKAGRQRFKSLLTSDNDTKMIPNTFLGYTLTSDALPYTHLTLGYLTRQKLRDHASFHHILAYGFDPNDAYGRFEQNDDSAMHRGLTLSKLQASGIDDRMWVVEVRNRSFAHLSLLANATVIPDLLSYAGAEAHYTQKTASIKWTTSVRYIRQFDEGAGAIGGANLKGVVEGYGDPYDLNGWLVAVREDIGTTTWRWRIAYSQTGDRGDIVAPWRGFPTGGYTRVMGQYNWYANTRTWMTQFNYDFDKAGLVEGLQGMVRVAWQDYDDAKPGVPADSNVLETDLRYHFTTLKGSLMRLRWAHTTGKNATVSGGGFRKLDPSLDEVRLEFDYLF